MFELSVYVEAAGLWRIEHDPQESRRFFGLLERLGVGKIYLETYRGCEGPREAIARIDDAVARRWRARFADLGLKVAGGLCVGTWAKGFGQRGLSSDGYWLNQPCYTSEPTHRFYRDLSAAAAEVFDDILVDDWLFNSCACDHCLDAFAAARGGRRVRRDELHAGGLNAEGDLYAAWREFSAGVIRDFAVEMIGRGRRSNPLCRFRWKLPEWKAGFRNRGIEPRAHAELWDGFLIGSEAREGVAPYAGTHAFHYLRSLFGPKAQGVWFDILCGYDWRVHTSPERFVRQMQMSVLSGAPEVVIWCYPEIGRPESEGHLDALIEALPGLRDLWPACQDFHGLPAICNSPRTPPNHPEAYLFDHLGGMGIPLVPRASLDDADRAVLITAHSEPTGLAAWVRSGGRAIVTSGGARELIAAGQADLLGVDPDQPIDQDLAFVGSLQAPDGQWHTNGRGHEQPMVPFGPILRPREAGVLMAGRGKGGRLLPVALRRGFGAGEVITLSFTDSPHLFGRYYNEISRQLLRDLTGELLGVSLRAARGTLPAMALFPLGETIVVVNLERCPAAAVVRVEPALAGVRLEDVDVSAGGVQEVELSIRGGGLVTLPLIRANGVTKELGQEFLLEEER